MVGSTLVTSTQTARTRRLAIILHVASVAGMTPLILRHVDVFTSLIARSVGPFARTTTNVTPRIADRSAGKALRTLMARHFHTSGHGGPPSLQSQILKAF